MTKYDVIIVGGGHSGAQTAIELRNNDFKGSILIVSNEKYFPYDRPSLSKDYFLDKKNLENIYLHPEDVWEKQSINFVFEKEVTAVNAQSYEISLCDGSTYSYRSLIWATGGRVRKLQIGTPEIIESIQYIKNFDDIERIKTQVITCQHVTVIGGGYIGLEAAAALRQLNVNVTLLEAGDRLLGRVTGQKMSQYVYTLHESHDVDLRLNVKIDDIIAVDNAYEIILEGQDHIQTDMIIAGIGILPNTETLAAAGITCHNGVVIDDYCRTSQKNIFAIGDCASHCNDFSGYQYLRLESIQNANDMAKTVADFIAASPAGYRKTPWFWSEQFTTRLQTVGLLHGYDQEIIRGEFGTNKFSVLYFKANQLLAVDCVNNPKDFVQAKNLVGKLFEQPTALSDDSKPLKTFVYKENVESKENIL